MFCKNNCAFKEGYKMPNIKSAIKRVKVNKSNNTENKIVRKMYREAVKAFEANPTEELYRAAVSSVDKAWSKGVLKRNTADRKKANLSKLLSK